MYLILIYLKCGYIFVTAMKLKHINLNTLYYEHRKFIKRFICGLYGGLDIHGMEWDERVVLKVVAFDRTNGVLIVENENGLQWKTNLKSMVFCLENGNFVNN